MQVAIQIRHFATALCLAIAIGLTGGSAHAQSFKFADSVPSFNGGSFLQGVPQVYFSDTGETRPQKAWRVLGESIGGLGGVSNDLFDIATAPVREPVLFGAAAIGTALLVANDYQFTTFYQDKVEPIFAPFELPPIVPRTANPRNPLNQLGPEDQYMLLGMAAFYAYGYVTNDERAQVATILATKAIAYSYLTSHFLLKPVFGRYRPLDGLSAFAEGTTPPGSTPGYTADPYRWGEGNGLRVRAGGVGTAFPSFHFTQFFAVARVYSGVYDNSPVPYVAAGLLAVANIRGHNHWVSDMAAGAFLGTVIGQAVLNNYTERRGMTFSAVPMVSRNGAGMNFTMTF